MTLTNQRVLINGLGSRSNSIKFMLLMTDGLANHYTDSSGVTHSDTNCSGNGICAQNAAIEMAQQAADLGINIVTVSMGSAGDPNSFQYAGIQQLMDDIADIGHGQHYTADGTKPEIEEALKDAFGYISRYGSAVIIE